MEYLIGRGTLDEHIWGLVESKLDVLGQTLDGESVEMGAEKSADELVASTFDPSSALYGNFINTILHSVDLYDERRNSALQRRAERNRITDMELEPANTIRKDLPDPGARIMIDMNDGCDSSQPTPPKNILKRPTPLFEQVTEMEVVPMPIPFEIGSGSGLEKLSSFALPPPKRRKKQFVD